MAPAQTNLYTITPIKAGVSQAHFEMVRGSASGLESLTVEDTNHGRFERGATGSLALSSRQTNLDAAGGHLGVFLFPHEVDLGRPNIRVAGKLADFVHG